MKPQKVLKFADELKKKTPKINHEAMVSVKLDGWYEYIDYNTLAGWGPICSSANRVIPSKRWARELFEKLPTPKANMRFIMEATIPDMDFHTMNGIFNRSVGDCQATDAIFNLHDVVLLDSYYIDIAENKALNRYKLLQQLDLSSTQGKIKLNPLLDVTSDRLKWERYFNEAIDNDEEGIILKQTTALYYPEKRNSSLMKMKLEESFDFLCTNMYWTLGEKGNDNLNLMLKDKAGTEVPVRIGKHKDITEFTKTSPVGKVIEIRCMKRTSEGFYREPRFKCVRHDKTINDID